MSILYSKTGDINFKEFYDSKSAEVVAKLVLDELEAIQRSNRLADESVIKNFGIKSHSGSPKLKRVNEIETEISYSHKIKTKMIWKEKSDPKNKRYNKTPDRLEPSKCILLDGRIIEIGRDIPIRSGEDAQSPEMIKELFPTFLRLFESIQEEKNRKKDRNEQLQHIYELSEDGPLEESTTQLGRSGTPRLVEGLSMLGFSHIQRGVQFFTRQFSDSNSNDNPAIDICEQLLKDELDENSKEIPFSRDPTPPPFIIPNKLITNDHELTPLMEPDIIIDNPDPSEESDNFEAEIKNENDDSSMPKERKKPNRRKRKKNSQAKK
jgi:hypothetical protein